eukprot:GEMP01073077.1.p1 GENE.GEMP01073077.1~~GEMP01073077.1.p1  ORF type:complete len:142 (-),score=14.32 GEMP01073077.1:241-666(-)
MSLSTFSARSSPREVAQQSRSPYPRSPDSHPLVRIKEFLSHLPSTPRTYSGIISATNATHEGKSWGAGGAGDTDWRGARGMHPKALARRSRNRRATHFSIHLLGKTPVALPVLAGNMVFSRPDRTLLLSHAALDASSLHLF